MEGFIFEGGQFHILYKPALIGKEGNNIQIDYDLTTPPALSQEQVKNLGGLCIQINKAFKEFGITAWVSEGYKSK